MIINCAHCTCRFRIDDDKVPSGSFTVSCPKCQTVVAANGTIQAQDQSALGVGNSPSTTGRRKTAPAPLFRLSPQGIPEDSSVAAPGANELAAALIGLLKGEKSVHKSLTRSAWDHRRVLVCAEETQS